MKKTSYKIDAFYPDHSEPLTWYCLTGKEARHVITSHLTRGADFCVATHIPTGVRQVYTDGLPFDPETHWMHGIGRGID